MISLFPTFLRWWGSGIFQYIAGTGSFDSYLQGTKTEVDSLDYPQCVAPPEECPNINITFWYYSRSNPDHPMQLLISYPQSLSNLPRNQNPWKIIIHGYTKSKDDIPNPQLRSAYLARGDYNLISVDYEPIARSDCYVQAAYNVPLIAKCTAQIIDALTEKNYFNLKNLHVIGFSLGGQVAGNIWKYSKYGKPGRITGLDPAGPLFDGIFGSQLTSEAGEFVDVIHTNGLYMGQWVTGGHVDFYVNGGIVQPGCQDALFSCSHNRATLYYAESINSVQGFWGIPCRYSLLFYLGLCNTDESKMILMGEYIPNKKILHKNVNELKRAWKTKEGRKRIIAEDKTVILTSIGCHLTRLSKRV